MSNVSPPKIASFLPFVPIMLLKGQTLDVCSCKIKKKTCMLSRSVAVMNKGKDQQLQGWLCFSGSPDDAARMSQWDHGREKPGGGADNGLFQDSSL